MNYAIMKLITSLLLLSSNLWLACVAENKNRARSDNKRTLRGQRKNNGEGERTLQDIIFPDRKRPSVQNKNAFKLPRRRSSVFPKPLTPQPTTQKTPDSPSVSPSTAEESLSSSPSAVDSDPPNKTGLQARFYVPSTNQQKIELSDQIKSLPEDADFLIHLGDIRPATADPGTTCELTEYQEVANILRSSAVPVFIIPGDNEWNNCLNPEEGWSYWNQEFLRFDEKWSSPKFQVERFEKMPENFSFVYKNTLFIGLNLVAGVVLDSFERFSRLTEEFLWTHSMIESKVFSNKEAGSVVIFGHAAPGATNDPFFKPLEHYLEQQFVQLPLLYLNGEGDAFVFKKNFLGSSNAIRLQVRGGAQTPPLQVTVNMPEDVPLGFRTPNYTNVFSYGQML